MVTSGLRLTLDSFDLTREAVRRVPEQARGLLSQAVAQTAFAATQRAKAGAPVSTGTLRNAITAKLPGNRGGLTGSVQVGPHAFYWRFVEYGTKHVAARPFIRTAAEMETNAFVERVRSVGVTLERDFATSRFT